MRERQQNLEVGDIVLVRYVAKYGRDAFRLARVVKLHPDRHGSVRTVTVWLRNRARAPREGAEACGQGVVELKAPVQHLVLIHPAEDQPEEVLSKLRRETGAQPAGEPLSPREPGLHSESPPEPEQGELEGTPRAQGEQGQASTSPLPRGEAALPPLPQRVGRRQRAGVHSRELALPYKLSPARPGGRKIGRI